MQFVITAYDHTDDDAINRRMAAREEHLAAISENIKKGIFLSGGAILDDNDKMVGSTIHLEIDNEQALEKWLESDPYYVNDVWEEIEIQKVKLVPQDL